MTPSRRVKLWAGCAATLAMWLAAYVWHHVLWSEFYVRNLLPGNEFTDVNIPLLFLGYLQLGVAMAWLAPKISGDHGLLRAGVETGFALGFIAVAPMTVMLYAVGAVTGAGVIVDMSWHLLVEQPLGGVVVVKLIRRL